MDNTTIKIDPITHDLVIGEDGGAAMISGSETVAQCVRLTLEVFQGCWPLDLSHGTDYDKIVGQAPTDEVIDTVIRAAIYQETEVRYIDSLTVTRAGRNLGVAFSGRLRSGATINVEVGTI